MHATEFARLWMRMTKEWKTHLEDALAPGLTEGQLNVLELLLAHQPMKPSDLLQYLSTTPAAITTLLDRMERGGLITRSRDQADRRIVWINVTENGEQEAKRGMEVRERYIQQALDRISSHNQQLLVYLLGKVANTEATVSSR
ncbi:MarR family winged helix-turn-helix transcriptional regulator [Paenibacillus tarimensis]|uniref:MarR family winged helix-turn-helix transcriptional regulator n=1 Tax=Paenibacillus tarimensis TaxID=416012 RepID=UPI001F2500F1|nr:MarR family transcriptional regulator [Paenibacillus tarimensis]MCF2942623.1 MarR family transcriptional regulator [Paenibacillus tarimensis]